MIRRSFSLIAAAAIAMISVSAPTKADIYGLMVGIDQYEAEQNLQGAVADAKDIADALEFQGAREVVVLLNEKATYDRVAATLASLIDKARPGDTLVFSYSGHGTQMDNVEGDDNEKDGRDELWVLGGFNQRGGRGEFILDDGLHDWLRQAAARKLNVILVSDSCHSGTLTRSIDKRACPLPSRLSKSTPTRLMIRRRRPKPVNRTTVDASIPNLLYIGAAPDDEKVQEVWIGTQARGALSFSVAQAIRGLADDNGDNALDGQEIQKFVRNQVAQLMDYRQLPQISVGEGFTMALDKAERREGNRSLELGELGLRVVNGELSDDERRQIVGVKHGSNQCGLTWDRKAGHLVTQAGDVTSYNVTSVDALQALILKHRLVGALKLAMSERALTSKINPGFCLFKDKDRFQLYFEGAEHSYWTIFGVDARGRIMHYFPLEEYNEKAFREPGKAKGDILIEAAAPFGGEYIVALVTDRPVDEFLATLAAYNEKIIDEAFVGEVKRVLGRAEHQIAIQSYYSAKSVLQAGEVKCGL
ncbi:MAG: caspase family protein [Hyphomicrobiaceae bacterium]